jgi:hypothetical protein
VSWQDPATGTANTQKNYKKLGDLISDARMAGLLDWEGIEDRTRALNALRHWGEPQDILEGCAHQFRLDKWRDQRVRLEVWVEKDALEGVVARAAHDLDVAVFSCRGYASMSSLWEAAQRFGDYWAHGQRVVVLHLGDHDPSGIDMTRDIEERLKDFLLRDWEIGGAQGMHLSRDEIWSRVATYLGGDSPGLIVRRIALTMDQVRQYSPPPNPAKTTDSRYRRYASQHGDESWELDALEPSVLHSLITDAIGEYVDIDAYAKCTRQEEDHRCDLSVVASAWKTALTAAWGARRKKSVKRGESA